MGASEEGLAARSPVSNSIMFTLPMQLHQMQPSLKSTYDRHLRGWNFFVSTLCLPFPPPAHFTLPLAMHPLPLHPPQMPLVGLPLWIEERGLTKVSMVTVHSVNHAAADVSSPSLFPFSSLHCCHPHACTNPSLSVSSPLVYVRCILSSLSVAIRKPPFLWSTRSPLPHFLLPPLNHNLLLLLF